MNLSYDPDALVEMVRGITNDNAEERWAWASVPGYLCDIGLLNGDECPMLAAILAWAALAETSPYRRVQIREGVLSSLTGLIVLDLVPTEVLELVTSQLSRDDLNVTEAEGYDILVATLEPHRQDHRTARQRGSPSLDPGRLVEMLRGITSNCAEQRRAWAATPGEHCDNGDLAGYEATTLAAVLAWATVIETDTAARSGFLSSLNSLARAGLVPTAVLQFVISRLSRASLDNHEVESYEALRDKFDEQRNSTLRILPRDGSHHSDDTDERSDAE